MDLYKEILQLDIDSPTHLNNASKILQLKLLFHITEELRDLNRHLGDGIYIENEEEMEERIKKIVLSVQLDGENKK